MSAGTYGKSNVRLENQPSYRDVLRRRLALLEDWTNRHSLESATQLINDTAELTRLPQFQVATSRGQQGRLWSPWIGDRAKRSLSPQGNPYNRSNRLTRRNGSPFFPDQEGTYYLRGEVIQGHYPLRKPNNQPDVSADALK